MATNNERRAKADSLRRNTRGEAEAALRAHALSYPEAYEDFPWGERVVKVRGKVFVFMGGIDGGLGLSVKLPSSASLALGLPFASPTAYGLGKSGWVTARFRAREKPPLDLLARWIDESYRAVAPKRLVAALDAPPEARTRPGKASSRARGRR
jgi:predicted DNA-binding protein (MmcQ/YjbR family)